MDETTVLSDGSRETKGMIVLAEASGMQVSANWLHILYSRSSSRDAKEVSKSGYIDMQILNVSEELESLV